MIISHKHKFIFVRTRKTATTSIEAYLSRYCSSKDVITPRESIEGQNYRGFFNPVPGIIKHISDQKKPIKIHPMSGYYGRYRISRGILIQCILRNKFSMHMPAFFIKQRIPDNIWKKYYKFTVERNPWDKTISWYYQLKNNNKKDIEYSFDKFMQEDVHCLNYPLYTDVKQEKIIVDKVIYYEDLKEGLSEVFSYLGIPFEGKLGLHEKSQFRKDKRPYQEYFSGDNEIYIHDIEQIFRKEIEMHGYTFDSIKN